MTVDLSDIEYAQLGSRRLLANGKLAAHQWPTPEQWPKLRRLLVARSKAANPNLDGALTAYTPGETLDLLDDPAIQQWHQQHATTKVNAPKDATIVLVPCAKTKPWTGSAVKRSKLYSAYNQIIAERDDVFFATISEPLGIVPQDRWGNFLQYDNPGLFHDDAQRSGMTVKQWQQTEFGRPLAVPFDPKAWQECINQLGVVIAEFLQVNQDRRFISFVDERVGRQSTHGAMLDIATQLSGISVERHVKRAQARVSPLDHIRASLKPSLADDMTPPARCDLSMNHQR